ncbi:MAG: PilN domain-containing protein [Thermodesulfobacteria bacterium]|nr:PilN domain-containing protein [Thermodesulfobacteriota bacterium]
MVRINLLPVREIKRRARAKQEITLFGLALIAFLVLLGVIGFFQASKAKQLKMELTKIRHEKQRYSKVLKQIKQLEKDKKTLEKKIDIIHRLKAESSLTVHILDEIANRTPTKRMWLTSLNQKGGTLTLKGMALDNRTIAGYMESLKQSPYIKDVNLTNSSLKKYAGRDLKSFSLTCSVGVPQQTEKKNTPNSTKNNSANATLKQHGNMAMKKFARSMHVVPGEERVRAITEQSK